MSNIETFALFLMENMKTSVLLFDADRKLLSMNPEAENLLSVSCKKMAGQDARSFLPHTPEFAETVERSLLKGVPYTHLEFDIQLSNMKAVVADTNFTPVNIDDDKLLIVELTDTHSRNRIAREENMLVQNTVAEESARAMAHEVKNPLGGIRGAAQLLQHELDSDDLKEYTQIIMSEADRLRNLIDKMLGPQNNLNPENLNIHEVLEYVCSVVTAEESKPFTLLRDYDPSLPDITADRDHLIQAILNLVQNAIEAIDNHGTISLRTRAVRQVKMAQKFHRLCLRIDVIDNGPGIPEELKQSVFYPMITGKVEGTGLGLPIAQSLIQKHGGIIEHRREHSHTIFTITLPWEN